MFVFFCVGQAPTQKTQGPRGWGAQRGPNPEKVEAEGCREGWRAQNFALSFCLSRHKIRSGGLLVEFWWCLKRWSAQMCTFGVLWLSCEAVAAPKPPGFHKSEILAVRQTWQFMPRKGWTSSQRFLVGSSVVLARSWRSGRVICSGILGGKVGEFQKRPSREFNGGGSAAQPPGPTRTMWKQWLEVGSRGYRARWMLWRNRVYGGSAALKGAERSAKSSRRGPSVRPSSNDHETQRERNGGGRGKEKREILGPPPSGSHPSGASPFGAPPFQTW